MRPVSRLQPPRVAQTSSTLPVRERIDWMPFAGLRQSGLGVGGIPYTWRDMQVEKMCVIRIAP